MIDKKDIKIGLKFIKHGRKAKRIETLVDIHKTYNLKGELVKTRYVSEYDFLGQKMQDKDIVITTIQRSEKA